MNALENYIKEIIRTKSPITFTKFMDIALYHPELGYYSKKEGIGASGDYYTSVVAHPVFGALLCLQLEQMWRLIGCPNNFLIAEQGAGSGKLANNIIKFAEQYSPQFADCIRYYAIDKCKEGTQIADYYNSKNVKTRSIKSDTITLPQIEGCIISNELLDAFPVHRIIKHNGGLKEIYAGLVDGQLKDVIGELSTDDIQDYMTRYNINLVEGQTIEVNLEAQNWIKEVAGKLRRGYIITIDYGYISDELHNKENKDGTLMCYYRHSYHCNPYLNIGEQDITSDVNFSAIVSEGERLGLISTGLLSQRDFLKNLGIDIFLQILAKNRLRQNEYYCNQFAVRQLISAEGTGGYRVLVQSKAVPHKELYCLRYENELQKRLYSLKDSLYVPVLNESDINLLIAKYPHLGINPGDLIV